MSRSDIRRKACFEPLKILTRRCYHTADCGEKRPPPARDQPPPAPRRVFQCPWPGAQGNPRSLRSAACCRPRRCRRRPAAAHAGAPPAGASATARVRACRSQIPVGDLQQRLQRLAALVEIAQRMPDVMPGSSASARSCSAAASAACRCRRVRILMRGHPHRDPAQLIGSAGAAGGGSAARGPVRGYA